MFIDASAMVAMLTYEPEGDRLARLLNEGKSPMTSATTVYETAARLMSKSSLSGRRSAPDGRRIPARATSVVALGEREAQIALEAFERFGKRRHPANLNIGDRFAYACAKAHHAALLFIGGDFSQTDVDAADD
jgi:ribonuclease VapC